MKLRKLKTMEKYLIVIITIYMGVVAFKNPKFLTFATFHDFLKTISTMLILSAGVLIVLISGGIDVSFTAIAVVSGYSSILISMKMGIDSLIFCMVISMLIGIILGIINSIIIHKLKLSTFIVTLGTSNVFYGFMTTFIGTKSITVAEKPNSLLEFSSKSFLGIPAFFIIAVVILIITWIILNKIKLGKCIYAIGNSEEAAYRIGINVFMTKAFIFGYMGLLSGIMGIVYFSEIDLINPVSLVGTELMIIAAVIIGGIRLTGGEGTVLGAILGITTIHLFKSTLVFLGLSTSLNDLFIGAILLISVSIMSYQQRKSNEKQLIFMK